MTRRKVDGAVYEDVENPYELTAQELLDAKPELNLVLDPMHKEFDKRAIEDAMVVHLLARLENPLKEVEVPSVKEYKWLPRADASIEEAFASFARQSAAQIPSRRKKRPRAFLAGDVESQHRRCARSALPY